MSYAYLYGFAPIFNVFCSMYDGTVHSTRQLRGELNFGPVKVKVKWKKKISRYKFRKKRKHIHHYYLMKKYLQRLSSAPPKLWERILCHEDVVYCQPQSSSRFVSSVSWICPLVVGIGPSDIYKLFVDSIHWMNLLYKFVIIGNQPSVSSIISDFQSFETDTTSSDILHQVSHVQIQAFCELNNFLQLNTLCTEFLPSSKYESILDFVNNQRLQYGSILYNSDQEVFPIGPNCVFFNQSDINIPIVVDSGASKGLSPIKSDFIKFTPCNSHIDGIGASSAVKGKGIVRWKVVDLHGDIQFIECEAYYVPSARIRLYSPQHHFQSAQEGHLYMDKDKLTLRLPNSSCDLRFPYHPGNHLPLMIEIGSSSLANTALVPTPNLESFYSTNTQPDTPKPFDATIYDGFDSNAIAEAFLLEQNVNLTKSQAELLHLHYCCGHISMHTLQKLIRPKALPPSDIQEVRKHPVVFNSKHANTHTCVVPKCAACVLSKMERVSKNDGKSTTGNKGELKVNDLSPGDTVSLDQYVVSTKGRTLTHFSDQTKMYNGGTIFVDHASNYMFNYNQISLRTGETLVGKRIFEREANDLGFKIKHFRADNGVFTSEEFKKDLTLKNQTLNFSGVGAHHQNGVAERSIKTVSYLARAMLIHASLRWPIQADLSQWPLAFDHAVYVYNRVPGSDGLSPLEKWTNTISDHRDLKRLHPWGCPAYVLDPTLQDGKKIPKWKPRSRQGRFVGYSKSHSSTVALILNPTTSRISPQFHVLFDDLFTTVRGVDDMEDPVLENVDWDNLISLFGTDNYLDLEDPSVVPPPLDPEWNESERPAKTDHHNNQREKPPNIIDLTNDADDDEVIVDDRPILPVPNSDKSVKRERITETEGEVIITNPTPIDSPTEGAPLPEGDNSNQLGRGHRVRKKTVRFHQDPYGNEYATLATGPRRDYPSKYADPNVKSYFSHSQAESFLKHKESGYAMYNSFIQNLDWDTSISALASSSKSHQAQHFFAALETFEDPETGTLEELHPLMLSAKANDEDNPRWFDATQGENREGFWEGMFNEIETLTGDDIDAWEQVERTPDMKVVLSTWAFKIKRFPSGLVRKLKSRFCVRGDTQEEGIDYFESYAPVVQWATVRTLLILSVILNLASTQVDYTAAFCQAPIDTDVYISLPRGWKQLNRMGISKPFKEGHVLKLKRSLYGMVQSPRNFFRHLKGNLLSCGFSQSDHDPCLFISEKVICLVYVDDCLFFAKDQQDIDTAIQKIKNTGMDLNVEDDVAGFLGVLINRNDDGTITLSQTGLIDRVVDALGLSSSNPKETPAPIESLGQDLQGSDYSKEYNYASVVGMMGYLCNNSRPDIAFAVSQCARYTHKPTEQHSKYLKHIGRYLKLTRDKGLILNPTTINEIQIDCYVDADFAGLWKQQDEADPHCVRSRAGHVIMVNGCPIIWKSKLLSEITLSTMESEYIAMSLAARALLPIQRIIKEVATTVDLAVPMTNMHSTIWEDNNAALKLANLELPYMTNRSKHIAIKYHWFRAHVGKDWVVKPIDTKVQIADIFTKGLPAETFKRLRYMLMGW